jgi:hypothetical protein
MARNYRVFFDGAETRIRLTDKPVGLSKDGRRAVFRTFKEAHQQARLYLAVCLKDLQEARSRMSSLQAMDVKEVSGGA